MINEWNYNYFKKHGMPSYMIKTVKFSQMGHLSVVIPPDIADEDGSEASALEGGSVELHCSAAGVPEPTISWKRTGGRNIVFRGDNGKEEKGSFHAVGSTYSWFIVFVFNVL